MNEPLHPALLPLGLRDVLPPDAAAEAQVVARLMTVLTSHGYERVKPPLAEFEDNLLSGAGAAMAKETFRLMDPISQRMIGLRADMTPQVARIATTRLKNAPRPLRLCYAGQVRLASVVERLARVAPGLVITIDPVENRGFEYHTGVSFTFFARSVRGELGRGGRYRTGNGGGEPATGFTLYTDTVLRAAPKPETPSRLFLPARPEPALGPRLRRG